jgi:hypothetical protein
MFFSAQGVSFCIRACVDLDTPFKSFDMISLCHCYAELYEIYTKRYSSPSDRLAYPLLLSRIQKQVDSLIRLRICAVIGFQ